MLSLVPAEVVRAGQGLVLSIRGMFQCSTCFLKGLFASLVYGFKDSPYSYVLSGDK